MQKLHLNPEIPDRGPEGAPQVMPVPAGTDPALLPSLRRGLARAVDLMVRLRGGDDPGDRPMASANSSWRSVIEPDLGLVEERFTAHAEDHPEIFEEEEWLTARHGQPAPQPEATFEPLCAAGGRPGSGAAGYSASPSEARSTFRATNSMPRISRCRSCGISWRPSGTVADTWKICCVVPLPEWKDHGIKGRGTSRPSLPRMHLIVRIDLYKTRSRNGTGDYVA